MQSNLDVPFTAAEIYEALSSMGPNKAPGPDGFHPIFFQQAWAVVGTDVTAACLHILNHGGDVAALNHTNVVLIPKVKTPTKMQEFRPISLCNVVYKIVTKVIANRLKHVLVHLISEHQSAFVPGRLINDNIVVGFETMHSISHKTQGKEGLMAVKLDMSKAYD